MKNRGAWRGLAAVLIFSLFRIGAAAESRFDAGANAYLSSDLDKAASLWRQGLQSDKNNGEMKRLLADCLVILGKRELMKEAPEKGCPYLKEACALFPDEGEWRGLHLSAELERACRSVGPSSLQKDQLSTEKENAEMLDLLFRGRLASAPESRRFVHIVCDGETMATLAEKYYHDSLKWPLIWKGNPDIENPHRLFPGTKVIIILPASRPVGK